MNKLKLYVNLITILFTIVLISACGEKDMSYQKDVPDITGDWDFRCHWEGDYWPSINTVTFSFFKDRKGEFKILYNGRDVPEVYVINYYEITGDTKSIDMYLTLHFLRLVDGDLKDYKEKTFPFYYYYGGCGSKYIFNGQILEFSLPIHFPKSLFFKRDS